MTDWRQRAVLALALAGLTACQSGGTTRDGDDSGCLGAKCDDLDGLDTGSLGKLDVPAVRADLGVDPSTTCRETCAVLSGCVGVPDDDCLLECATTQFNAAAHSNGCEEAADARLVCIAGLDCHAVGAFQTAEEGYPCEAEEQAVTAACAPSGPSPSVCEGFCAVAAGCAEADASACVAACAESIASAETVGDACGVAQTSMFECVAALPDCGALQAWASAEGDYACADADASVTEACTASEDG